MTHPTISQKAVEAAAKALPARTICASSSIRERLAGMAISRYDPEWMRTVAEATLAGIEFKKGVTSRDSRRRWITTWYAYRGGVCVASAETQYGVARAALDTLRSGAALKND